MTYLVGYSSHKDDSCAISLACQLSRTTGIPVHALTVVPRGWLPVAGSATDGEFRAWAAASGEEGASEALALLTEQGVENPTATWVTGRSVPAAMVEQAEELGAQIVVDSHERYPYKFPTQRVTTVRQGLQCGDYGLIVDGALVASVERKSLSDLVSSLTGGKLRFQIADLATLPRAAVVVEDRYSQLFKLDHIRPAVVADGLAELQVRWPNVPIVFCETRHLAEEWTYRLLAAAHSWANSEDAALQRVSQVNVATRPASAEPSTADVRAWARSAGLTVPDRGRLHPDIWQAWRDAT